MGLAFLILWLALQSPPTPPPAVDPTVDPAALLAEALADAAARGIPLESFALRIELPGGGAIAHRDDAPMMPASTAKLLTAAAALDLLGPEHRLVTELAMASEVRDGVLHGDLVVVGGGDPAPSSRRAGPDPLAELRPWVEAIAALGIRRVGGDLIADDRYLAGPPRVAEWPAEQLHRWYCAPSGALNLNDNCVDVTIVPREGKISAAISPPNALFSLENAIRPTAEKGKHLYSVDRAVDSWRIRLGGRFLASAPARTEWVTVPDPARAFLGAWRALLAAEGIAVEGELIVAARPAGAKTIARIEHRVADTLPVLLKNSQNLYGDCLLRVSDRENGGDGSFESAGERARAYLVARGGGAGAVIRDGSGLSRRNRLSCADLVRVLDRADAAPWRDTFWDALPLAAVDGTLDDRFRGGPLAGRLRGKTGNLAGVTGLAGGWETRGGAVRFAALSGGAGAKSAPFRNWLDRLLERVDAALGGAPLPAPPSGE